MRLFGYYALHTFKNQIKKLCKTWVVVFILVCALMGGLIGAFAASLSDDEPGEEIEQVLPEEDLPQTPTIAGADPAQIVELAAGGLVLALFLFMAMGADKNGSRIFQPADVNILFPSPMRPQSVLLFRLATQLGASLLVGFYLLFQLPSLVGELGLSVWCALLIVADFCLAVLTGTLLRVLLYILAATYPAVKRYLRPGLYAAVLLIAGGYLLSARGGQGYLPAALRFFNGPASRYIPFWGWLKAACGCAAAGQAGRSALYMALTVLGGAALVFVIWHIKADFYEDAMAQSEQTAELMARAQSEKSSGILIRRKKDRSDRLRRDGLRRGAGANVFFFKAMYNRFRFAHLGLFTKTLEFYLAAAVGTGLLLRYTGGDENILALVLGVLVFFRALGNPLEQDAGMDCFLLIPEGTWAKLFWSMMGTLANCALDLLPAMLAGALAAGTSLLGILGWLPLILSVDLYATSVGAFIGFSVPVNAGKTVKQLIQVLFVYFGLLPDIVIVVLGIVGGHAVPAAVGAAAVNVVLGMFFFSLSPLFLDPKPLPAATGPRPYISPIAAPAASEEGPQADLPAARRLFSRLGMGLAVLLGLATVLQLAAAALATALWPDRSWPGWVMWAATFLPMYAVAVPVGLLLWRKIPAHAPEKGRLSPGQMVRCVLISLFMMYAGNLVGNLVTAALQALAGSENLNPVLDYAMDGNLALKALVMVVIGPLVEEYVFRRQLIDRCRIYGEKLAVILSAAAFALLHGNFAQLFYAFALGLVFGYVYVKTGRLRYSAALHMFINFLGGIVGPAVLQAAGPDSTGLALAAYSLSLMALALAGLVVLCVRSRSIRFAPAEMALPRGSRVRTVLLNPGMILYALLCLASIALTVAA